jgi:5-dehydro-2-deoxygluconokinase
MAEWTLEVAVFGRVSYDLNPLQDKTPLEDVTTFERSVGGFAGNVATGLARLGVPVLVASAVGDDPHGRYIRRWLLEEGVDVAGLAVHPTLRTALAFYESWPPDHFPITLFRSPTAPDWEMGIDDVPFDRIVAARGLIVSGTALARSTSAATMRALVRGRPADPGRRLTVFDLDWRPMAWLDASEFARAAPAILECSDVVVGGDAEFKAAGLSPETVAAESPTLVIVKHGPDGASLLRRGIQQPVSGIDVPVTVGLGAGDAFVAALVAGLFEGRDEAHAVYRANAAGAIVASRPMCSPAMPRVSEIEALLAGKPAAGITS